MFILAPNGTAETYPYSIGQLRKDNPQVSFPKNPTDALLASYNVFVVTATERPVYDPITQNLSEGSPIITAGVWTQVWAVTEATPEEVAQRKADQLASLKQQRAYAYTQEADPLFFKAQRGEILLSEWEVKVDEIRARYPYPVE
tara:strand:- start:187 stop:618 length:432 start_codon:yes stop_codon:yes gene_type:complete